MQVTGGIQELCLAFGRSAIREGQKEMAQSWRMSIKWFLARDIDVAKYSRVDIG